MFLLDPCRQRIPRAELYSCAASLQGPAVVRVHRYHGAHNFRFRFRRRSPAHRQQNNNNNNNSRDDYDVGDNYYI